MIDASCCTAQSGDGQPPQRTIARCPNKVGLTLTALKRAMFLVVSKTCSGRAGIKQAASTLVTRSSAHTRTGRAPSDK